MQNFLFHLKKVLYNATYEIYFQGNKANYDIGANLGIIIIHSLQIKDRATSCSNPNINMAINTYAYIYM